MEATYSVSPELINRWTSSVGPNALALWLPVLDKMCLQLVPALADCEQATRARALAKSTNNDRRTVAVHLEHLRAHGLAVRHFGSVDTRNVYTLRPSAIRHGPQEAAP